QKRIQHFINGTWLDSSGQETIDVINPATEETFGQISNGTAADIDQAVKAARQAFPTFSATSKERRIDMLDRIISAYEDRKDDIIETIILELGATRALSEKVHYQMGLQHFKQAKLQLETFEFEENRGTTTVRKEPIGVC